MLFLAGTMWKKVKQAGKVPHLSRWFDYVADFPECKSVVDELDLNSRRKAATATEGTVDSKKGGGGEFDSLILTLTKRLMPCVVPQRPSPPNVLSPQTPGRSTLDYLAPRSER